MSTDTKLLAAQAANKRLRDALELSIGAIRLFRNEPKLKGLVGLRGTQGYVAMDVAMDQGCFVLATPDDTAEIDALVRRADVAEAKLNVCKPFYDAKGCACDVFDYDMAVNDLIDEVIAHRRGVGVSYTSKDPLDFFNQLCCGPIPREQIIEMRKAIAAMKEVKK